MARGQRPNHHQLPEPIAAHVLLCVLGTFLVRLGELKAGRTWSQLHRALEPVQGGNPVMPAEVYAGGIEVQLRAWQPWAKAAKEKLNRLLLQDAQAA